MCRGFCCIHFGGFCSFLPNFNLNLSSAQLAISNHGLETTVYRPLVSARNLGAPYGVVIRMGVEYIALPTRKRACLCESIAIEMGGASPGFSKASGSGSESTKNRNRNSSQGALAEARP